MMLTIHKQPAGKGAAVLKLEGEITIDNAGQLREALLEGLCEQDHLQLDCNQVSTIDLFGIQMICSAHRTSIAWNKHLIWHGTLPPVAEDAIRRTGFARHHGCDLCPDGVCCMWI